ncbi:DUF11 domain-containing protein [Sediminibacterium sp.]|uniref:DUF11 domain-containing protein n=1 Tax=Sediminibacterium sp. TaxID=1917865 RepID=UPI0027366FBF|nr:DUF11 domain-containing protein [Sediminibacterium sp.]MDP3568969.1 DUF11 domain-containing protein [Sediminibacterium sp.]
MNTSDEATDLAVNITGNASSVGIGDTVRLVISLSNLGPNACDAKLNYKIPVGLKLLSSQGPGAYDEVTGVWNAGLLLVNDTVSLDLVLQATNIGYFVNMVSVYGDLTSTHAVAAKPIVKVFNGKWRSTAAMSDSNGGNNKASFSLDVRSPTYQTPSHEYKWPYLPDPTPTPTPQPDNEPQPTPQPDLEPPSYTPDTQLQWDTYTVRDSVSKGKAEVNQWNMTVKEDSEQSYIDVPMWAWGLIAAATAIGAYLTVTSKGEYLKTTIIGQINSLIATIIASSWFGSLKNLVTETLNKFVQKLVFDPSSTPGYSFNILSYVLTMAYPDLLGIIGTGFTVLSILAPIIGAADFAFALSILSAGIAVYGIYNVLKDIIYNK